MYGVDQCRMCGTPIPIYSRRAWEWQEKANLHPPIPEEEWRRRGYLCPPTTRQLNHRRTEGCCQPCARKEMYRTNRPIKTFIPLFLILVAMLTMVFLSYFYWLR
jgi:predicted nucleic acid-binding Zn ribbon protein